MHVEGVATCSHHSPCLHGCMHMGEAQCYACRTYNGKMKQWVEKRSSNTTCCQLHTNILQKDKGQQSSLDYRHRQSSVLLSSSYPPLSLLFVRAQGKVGKQGQHNNDQSNVAMGFMHLGLDRMNAAEKEAAMTQQSVVPCVLLCHIQSWHLFLQQSHACSCQSVFHSLKNLVSLSVIVSAANLAKPESCFQYEGLALQDYNNKAPDTCS